MFKSYWKTAIRSLLKNKTFGFINIFGLAAGTFCCLYILLYVRDQYSYDGFSPLSAWTRAWSVMAKSIFG